MPEKEKRNEHIKELWEQGLSNREILSRLKETGYKDLKDEKSLSGVIARMKRRGVLPKERQEVKGDRLAAVAKYAKASPVSGAVDNLLSKVAHKLPSEKLHKLRSEEMRISISLRIDQIEALDRLRREIIRKRTGGQETERITKGSIVRAYIDVLSDRKIDTKGIDSEAELLNRVLHHLGSE